ncbi:hypothetical protein [Kordiimonas lacus]|uniref:Uncharacterized protein n=1 Tax=Kordiimonas lacus TaxID=637679 RepID=A0A1G6TWF5_9PROT|nr:hypothetical protein [Kordiimonas lacus]SDD33389.1 hypothetical protein SAMN04488071_0384 [Kordiimonas lacus]
MTDLMAMDLIIFPLLITLTIGGLWYARAQAKMASGFMMGTWKRR